MPLAVRTDRPADVGADRLVNALAAHRLYGTPAVVVDFGTANTVDAVSAKGEYLGGAITPGVEIRVMTYGQDEVGAPPLNAASLRAVVASLRSSFDVVIVDAPTARHDYVASVLAGFIDHVVVVVARRTPTGALLDLAKLLEAARANLAGYIFTLAKPSRQR